MLDQQPFYTLRCAKCTSYFSTILAINGQLKMEKKCPKCKALNTFTLNSKQITIDCRISDTATDNFTGEEAPAEFSCKDEANY